MLAHGGWRVIVVTVFTRSVPDPSGFALSCQLDKSIAPDVDYMALRRREDERAMNVLRARPIWLPYPEAPHRGYGSAAELFGPLRPDDAIHETIAPAMQSLVDAERPDLVFAPQGIGGHVDHLQVVRAVSALSGRPSTLWWSDFPYVLSAGSDPRAAPCGTQPLDLALTALMRACKREACRAYETQIGFQFGGPERLDEQLAREGSERFRAQHLTDRVRSALENAVEAA
jgi:LmbE family N-acetylglucosaminyl deacetylase